MTRNRLLTRTPTAWLTTLIVGLAVSGFALAGKPGGGGGGSVPAGRIFYRWSSEIYAYDGPYEFRGWWSMNADGSDKQLAPYQPPEWRHHHLSYLTHQGHRWFLERRSSPNFAHGGALFAFRDDLDPAFDVLLVDGPDLPDNPFIGQCRWGQDDSFVSFVGIATVLQPNGFQQTDPTALAEIWVAGIAFDELTGLPGLTTMPLAVVAGEQPGFEDIGQYDWSPDGDEIVYALDSNPNHATPLLIKNLVTAETRIVALDSYFPVWSPDGSRIAFKPLNSGVHVIKPDGTSLLRLTNGWDLPTGWSPDSQHVLVNRQGYNKGDSTSYISDVLRVPAGGGSTVNLTKDIDGFASSRGWR
jgi:hypothetical protein